MKLLWTVLVMSGIGACERDEQGPSTPPPATTLVAHDDVLNKTEAVELLSDLKEPVLFLPGCYARSSSGVSVIVFCKEKELLLRFDCRDHPAGHALSFVVGGYGYSLHCQ